MKKVKVLAISLASCLLCGLATGVVGSNFANKTTSPLLKVKQFGEPHVVSGEYIPSQIKSAYGIANLGTGAGQTIAIVDAYGSPTIQKDLSRFDTTFGLPSANLTVKNPGGTPTADEGWALETSLDVEWAHAIAPQAKILLVQAKSSYNSDLMTAVSYATSQGANVVSISWGDSESNGETDYDSYFNKSGVTFLVSSGDSGAGTEWPASSPYVVAVGGTTLNINASGTRTSETGWSGSGGGVSSYESEPAWQQNFGISQDGRTVPDVSFDADPDTGVNVYDSTPYDGHYGGWWGVGGTSFSAPAWAGLVALANAKSGTNLSGADDLMYNLAGGTSYSTNDFYDITSGSNGYSASAGYDFVTGLGSPVARNLIPVLK